VTGNQCPNTVSQKLQLVRMNDVQCSDFLQFQSALKGMRVIDDKIVYALNNSIPTISFKGQVDASEKCKELHQEILKTYDDREASVHKCIEFTRRKLEVARSSGNTSQSRAAQLNLRLYKNELMIEEVIKARTTEIFHTKCRDHYMPPTSQNKWHLKHHHLRYCHTYCLNLQKRTKHSSPS